MLQKILTIGDKIDVRPLDPNGKPVHSSKTLVSQLVDIVDYDVVNIAAPIFYGKPIILKVGENFNLCFYSDKGLYQCNCVVLSNHKDNNTYVTVVRITTNLEKFQRRQYFRLECIHDIEYRIVKPEEAILDRKLKTEDFKSPEERAECMKKLKLLDNEWIQGSVTDLSGGGARFSSALIHNQGDKIKIKLDLAIGNTLKRMILGANIITSERIMNRIGVYEHRVEFNDIIAKDREELIKYIFEQDRRRRRNDKK